MKFSQTQTEALLRLPDGDKRRILYTGWADDGKPADAALLLGSRLCEERAAAAAALYHAGRAPYIVPSGGVQWEWGGEMISEARYMARLLRQAGVPEEAIILEDEARTTKENMICGTLQLGRALHLQNLHRVIIVTADYHMKRSLALARCLLPRHVEIGCAASPPPAAAPERLPKAIDSELSLLKGLVDAGMIPDIEF